MDTRPSPPGRINRRLWKAGGLLGLVFLTLLAANHLLAPDKSMTAGMYGKDFLPFYTAGQFIRTGRLRQIYDPAVLSAAEHATEAHAGLEVRPVYGAWLNPPMAALPAVWLAQWPYPTALWVWTSILAGLLIGAVALLVCLFPRPRDWRRWALVPLLLFTALPVWQAMLHAQNTFFFLAVLAAAVVLWRRGNALAAGLVAGLLFLKPQLGAVVAAVLVACVGRRALLGLAVSAATLLAINLVALPGSLDDFIHKMPESLRLIQSQPNFMWHRHITFLGFWRILLQGRVAALPTWTTRIVAGLCAGTVALALAWVVLKFRNHTASRDRLIIAAIASMPLVMPYYMDYDMTLLAVAAVLCAVDFITHGVDRPILLAWTALYLILEFNSGLAGSTRVVAAVPALAVLSALSIRRAAAPVPAQPQATPVADSTNVLPLAA